MPSKLAAPPTTSAEVQSLLATEIVRTNPDRFKLQYLTRLLDSFEAQEKGAETAASKLLPDLITERDALLPLREQAAKVGPLEEEIAALKTSNDEWRTEQTRLLTADAQQQRFKAEAALRAAEEKLHEADNKVLASGWTQLRATLAELISRHSVPMPSFWETSATMPSAFWTLWGWSPTKAKVYTAYKKSFESPTESFKQQVLRILTAGLPTFPVVRQQFNDDGEVAQQLNYTPTEIPDFGERRECLIEMATRFNCLVEIQREVEKRQAQIMGQQLQQNASDLQAQQLDMSRRGYGRQEQAEPEQSSITGYSGPCIDPANCLCPKCSGGRLPTRFSNSLEEIV